MLTFHDNCIIIHNGKKVNINIKKGGIFLNINNILLGVECACGKTHCCDIEHVYIESGAIVRLKTLCEQNEKILIVADENTYCAAGENVEKALGDKAVKKVIFPGKTVLIPNENAI